jgi:hypothetical protein
MDSGAITTWGMSGTSCSENAEGQIFPRQQRRVCPAAYGFDLTLSLFDVLKVAVVNSFLARSGENERLERHIEIPMRCVSSCDCHSEKTLHN